MEKKQMFTNFWPDATEFYNKDGEKALGQVVPLDIAPRGNSIEEEDPVDVAISSVEKEKLALVNLSHSPKLKLRLEKEQVDLRYASRIGVESFKKKVMLLLKLRKKMVTDMTASGNGSSEPDDFVQSAMAFVPHGGSVNRDAILYFFCQCEDKKGEIDTASTEIAVSAALEDGKFYR